MPIRIQCPKCGKKLTAKDELAGKNATCPDCKHVMVVPAALQVSHATPTTQSPSLPPVAAIGKASVPSASAPQKKRNLLPLYIGGGVAALCLVIVLVVIFAMSGRDASVAKSETAPKTESVPKPDFKKPEKSVVEKSAPVAPVRSRLTPVELIDQLNQEFDDFDKRDIEFNSGFPRLLAAWQADIESGRGNGPLPLYWRYSVKLTLDNIEKRLGKPERETLSDDKSGVFDSQGRPIKAKYVWYGKVGIGIAGGTPVSIKYEPK
jgi:phage FluMu protein Com